MQQTTIQNQKTGHDKLTLAMTLFAELDAGCSGAVVPIMPLAFTAAPDQEGCRLFTAPTWLEALEEPNEPPAPLELEAGHVLALVAVTTFFWKCTALGSSGLGAGGGGTNCAEDFLNVNLARRKVRYSFPITLIYSTSASHQRINSFKCSGLYIYFYFIILH